MKLIAQVLAIFAIIFIIIGYFSLKKSSIAHCIVVAEESDFTGEYLKHTKSVKDEYINIDECIKMDQETDNGNGEKVGKVRWYQCSKGPDCEEVGIY